MISYGCVYKRSKKPVMKVSIVETIDSAREEYKNYYKNLTGKLLSKIVFLNFYLRS